MIFRNHSNMLICCSRKFSYYYQFWNLNCLLNFNLEVSYSFKTLGHTTLFNSWACFIVKKSVSNSFLPHFQKTMTTMSFLKNPHPINGFSNREQTWADGTSEIFKRRNSRFYCTYVFWFPPTRSLDGFLATWNMTHHPLFWTCALLS